MVNRTLFIQNIKSDTLRCVSAVLLWIVEPSNIVETKQRHRARLLAAYFLFLTINIMLGVIAAQRTGNSAWILMSTSAIFFMIGYVLSRTRYYWPATVLAVTFPAFPAIAALLFSTNQVDVEGTLMWLVLPLLISTILLSLGYTIIIAISYIVSITILAFVVDIPVMDLGQSLGFITAVTFLAITITIIRQRDQSETEHQLVELKRAEEALRESEAKYSSLVEHGNDGIVILQDGVIKFANSKMVEMLGYSLEEAIGEPFIDFVSQEYRELVADNYRKRMAGEEAPMTYEFNITAKDGRIINAEVNASPLEYEGKPADMAIVRDITGRKRAQQALRESEERFSKAFHSSPNAMAITTLKDGIYIDVNDGFTHDNGYNREDVIGKSSKELKIWANSEERDKILQKLRKHGRVVNEEINARTRSGETRTKLFSAEPITVAGEACIIAMSTDITERKKREQLQHDENYVLTLLGQGAELSELLDAIVHLGEGHDPSIKGSVLLFDPSRECLIQASAPSLPDDYKELLKDGLPIGPNVGSCGTAAYLKERVIVTDIENSPLFKPFEEAVKRSINNGLLSCWSQPIISANGELLGTIANYGNKVGEPDAENLGVLEWSARIAAIAIERKQAEEALRINEERFRLIADNATDMISRIQMAPTVKTDYVSPSCLRLTGYKQEEFYADPNLGLEMIHPDDREFFQKHLTSDNKKYHKPITIRLVRKDGRVIWIEQTHAIISDEYGEPVAMHLIARDITERKQAERKLKKALSNLEHSSAQLAATNKELEAFSYSVSHDLRSPLRSIDGFSQALLEDYQEQLDENGQEYLRRLRGASQKMGELIDGILKLSRLSRSRMYKKKVNLSALVEEITARLHENQPERQAEFIISKGLSDRGDPLLLRALFENLLGNAWKFTSKRERARIEFGTTKNGGKKTYFINDNGAGFDMTYADKLFGAFQRLHEATEYPGTGIGLATVQRIINRHGGNIWAEGAVGKGATFYFTLN
jgi:PAS domain S-box-containing protein